MKKFESTGYQNFINSHIRLNYYIKISTGAVLSLHNSHAKPEELSEVLNQIIINAGERWTPTILQNPHNALKLVTNDLAKSGVIWVYSAFDVFFKKIEGELSGHFKSENSISEEESEDKSHKVVELYGKLKWDQTKINELLPILRFYESLRHSVAHNMGFPSGKIITIYESTEFKEAIDQWTTKFPDRQISPPPVITNTIIDLKPHHPILYSETCLRIASDINTQLITLLGHSHYIKKVIKKHLLDTPTLTEPHCQNLSRYIAYHLNRDYKIQLEKYNNVYEIFNGTEVQIAKIEDYKKKYNTLKSRH